jgi:hypothetical protein
LQSGRGVVSWSGCWALKLWPISCAVSTTRRMLVLAKAF